MSVEYSITIILVGGLIIGYTIKNWNSDQVVFPIRSKGHKIYKTQREKFMKVKNLSSIILGALTLLAGLISFKGNGEAIMVSLLAFGVVITFISEKVLKKCLDFGNDNFYKNKKKK
ncbi:MAG: hypothetical protein ACRDA4_04800 [Filifactoraceae bacterium]